MAKFHELTGTIKDIKPDTDLVIAAWAEGGDQGPVRHRNRIVRDFYRLESAGVRTMTVHVVRVDGEDEALALEEALKPKYDDI
jgi:hypothetical protein